MHTTSVEQHCIVIDERKVCLPAAARFCFILFCFEYLAVSNQVLEGAALVQGEG